ncbi:membrane protein insertase YidC, partial [Pseudorhodobacter sp.]|uniref:membrane protein insertase YidC n=1 Tax=Pseudorhodobacter sp. TaxID=1934400 RepID=UPI002648C435
MDDQNKNLILATVLSFLVILVWFVFFPPAEPVVDPNAPAVVSTTAETTAPPATAAVPLAPDASTATATLATTPRVAIDTPRLKGTISLLGGRIDDLALKTYHTTIDPKSAIVTLLSPIGQPHAYYAL